MTLQDIEADFRGRLPGHDVRLWREVSECFNGVGVTILDGLYIDVKGPAMPKNRFRNGVRLKTPVDIPIAADALWESVMGAKEREAT